MIIILDKSAGFWQAVVILISAPECPQAEYRTIAVPGILGKNRKKRECYGDVAALEGIQVVPGRLPPDDGGEDPVENNPDQTGYSFCGPEAVFFPELSAEEFFDRCPEVRPRAAAADGVGRT